MIDFEKFGWTPSDESQNEVDEQVQEEETVAEEEVPAVEEEHEEYQPVSQKKPGKANIVVVGVGGGGNNGRSAERTAANSTNRSRNGSDLPLRQPTDLQRLTR